jgi:O-antigen ligase
MTSKVNSRVLTSLLVAIGPIVTMFMTPNISLEPIDQPKMFVLTICAFGILGLILNFWKFLWLKSNRLFIITVALFLLQLTLVLFTTKSSLDEQFFGTFGRNTGWLTYFCLATVAVGASLVTYVKIYEKVIFSLLFTGLISILYSLLQHTGNDPIKWNNPNNSIIGFVGNPDFQSSLLGMSSCAAFAFAIRYKLKPIKRVLSGIYVCVGMSLVFMTHALQGILIFAIGAAFIIYANLKYYSWLKNKYVTYAYTALTFASSAVVVLGTLKIGPLSHALYKISVRQRGYYWHAAIKMANQNPLNGVGLDGYGDWYMKYRSASAALNSRPTQSNAAHNVYLDMAATGGWPLFILHLALFAAAILLGIKVIKTLDSESWGFIAVVGTLIAYCAQALVSINQIGLAIWGWLLLGLVFSRINLTYQQNLNPVPAVTSSRLKSHKRKISSPKSKNGIYAMIVGMVIGFLIVFPYFNNDAQFRKASNSRSASALMSAALAKPQDVSRILQGAQDFAASNLTNQAQQLLSIVLKKNPRFLNAWYMQYQLSPVGSADHNLARLKLNELNPKDPTK